MLLCLTLWTFLVTADPATTEQAHFEAPVRLHAGESFMGEKRLYPSPVMHDVDGDGRREIVIGDLIGSLTVCSADGNSWGASKALQGANGEPLKFNNW